MELQDALLQWKEKEAKLIAKTLEDDKFRKSLLDEPKAALEKIGGKPLPEGLNVRVMEEEANTLTIVLPQKPAAAGQEEELSDEALEKVSGGAVGSAGIGFILDVI